LIKLIDLVVGILNTFDSDNLALSLFDKIIFSVSSETSEIFVPDQLSVSFDSKSENISFVILSFNLKVE